MLAIKLATLTSNLWNVFWKERSFKYIIGSQSSFLQMCYLQLFKTDLARFVFLVSLGGNDYHWEIVGLDLVTGLTKSLEFHLTTIIDSWLPSKMAQLMPCREKSSILTKPWLSLFTPIIDFMVFHKSLCLNDNPALLAKICNILWEIWIPNSLRVRLDILELMVLLLVLMKNCK